MYRFFYIKQDDKKTNVQVISVKREVTNQGSMLAANDTLCLLKLKRIPSYQVYLIKSYSFDHNTLHITLSCTKPGSSRKQPLYSSEQGHGLRTFYPPRPFSKRDILDMFGLVWFIVLISHVPQLQLWSSQ